MVRSRKSPRLDAPIVDYLSTELNTRLHGESEMDSFVCKKLNLTVNGSVPSCFTPSMLFSFSLEPLTYLARHSAAQIPDGWDWAARRRDEHSGRFKAMSCFEADIKAAWLV